MASVFLSTAAEIVVIDSRTKSGTITLPVTNSIPYRVLNFKDQYGSFSNSTLTISTQTGESFDDGTTTKTFSNAFSYLSLYATSSKWMVMNATQTVQQTISSLTVNQLTFGTGAGWVQFGPVQATAISSIQTNTQTAYINNLLIGNVSTVNSAQFYGLFGNYNNTALAEISTGGGNQEFLVFKGSSVSDRIRFQTTGNFVVETGVSSRLWNSNTLQTLSNATPAFVINTSSNVGIQTANPAATLDVAGTGRFQTLSSLALNISSINGTVYSAGGGGGITTANLQSTVGGLGQIYISTAGGGLSLANLQSTVGGLGQIYLSTAAGGVTSIPLNLSTAAFFTSSVLASTITTSSLQVNSLTIGTGTGWVNLGPLQTVVVSSLQENTGSLYAANAYIGILSTASALQFNGLQANYTNTVLAEVSTGGGNQELLIFKGSSASDRVRVQTTGDVRFETGVSARLWSNTTVPTLSNVTPAMIINTSSNVGIQTASPGATLDVAGTGRFQVLSTLQLNVSSILGVTIGGGSLTTANLTSTVAGLGQIYISTATGGGSSGPVPYISALTVSTTDLFASTVSTYVMNTYAVTGSAFFNNGPDDMAITSLTNMNITTYSNITISPFFNLTMNNSQSTFLDTNTFYVNSINEVRMVSPQVITDNVYVNQGLSTYSLTIYGPSTLTVQGWSYFQNTVSSPLLVTNSIGVIDSVTGQPSYIQASNGSFDFNGGGAVLDQAILTSTIEGLGSLGYISTPGGMAGVAQIIAGTNITIDPIGGTGVVTINASGGGGGGGIASIPRYLSTETVFTSSMVAVSAAISSLTVDNLVFGDGNGWAYMGAMQSVVVSTTSVYTGGLFASLYFI